MAKIQETFRPKYHFTPQAQWMNDPNGMVFYKGEYHLFYQHNPNGVVHGPMYWGHAVSRDLLHWQHLPIALSPDKNGVIFSGSAVVDWHDTTGFFAGGAGLVAIFTHHKRDKETSEYSQSQSLAYSHDDGRTWTMYEDNPVLCSTMQKDFRDPKVFWYEEQQCWVMVLAVKDHVEFYKSPDLKHWTYLSSFAGGCFGGVWECPDLFELEVDGQIRKKWILEVDINPGAVAGGSGGQYFVGEFNGVNFVPDDPDDAPLWIDYGKDHYAGVSWSDVPKQDGRRLWLAWMSNWQYANHTPTQGWRNAMTVPRELSLREVEGRLRLVQMPVRELKDAVEEVLVKEEIQVNPGTSLRISDLGDCLDIELQLQNADQAWQLAVCRTATSETIIGFDPEKQCLYVDRSRSGLVDFHPDFSGRRQAPLHLQNGELSLRVLLDTCSVEVFAEDGLLSFTELIFPDFPRGGIEFRAAEEMRVRRLAIQKLNF